MKRLKKLWAWTKDKWFYIWIAICAGSVMATVIFPDPATVKAREQKLERQTKVCCAFCDGEKGELQDDWCTCMTSYRQKEVH